MACWLGRDVGNLVQEERAAVCQLEAARAVAFRVGESAFYVAEQFALEDAFGHPARVQRDERPAGPARGGVEGAGDDALARAVLAGDEDVGVRWSDAGDHVEHGAHGSGSGDHRRLAVEAQDPVLGLEPLALAQRPAQRNLRSEGRQQARVVPGFLHEVPRPAPHRFDRDLDGAPRRHDDDRQGSVGILDAGEQIEPFASRRRVACVVQVHEEDVEVRGVEGREDAVGGGGGFEDESLALQEQAESFEHVALVVGDENPVGTGGVWRFHGPGPVSYLGLKSSAAEFMQ